MAVELEKVKEFYRETWWLWALYAVGTVLAIWKVHWIFVFAVPMILIISLYFAVVRGPSRPRSDDDDVEKNS
jgi:hypothetical protein